MFKLQTSPLVVEWPVIIHVPIDGGKTQPHEITIKYAVGDVGDIDDTANSVPDVDLIKGWRDIHAEDGSELEYSTENLNKLLNIPYVRAALYLGYRQCAAGRAAKN